MATLNPSAGSLTNTAEGGATQGSSDVPPDSFTPAFIVLTATSQPSLTGPPTPVAATIPYSTKGEGVWFCPVLGLTLSGQENIGFSPPYIVIQAAGKYRVAFQTTLEKPGSADVFIYFAAVVNGDGLDKPFGTYEAFFVNENDNSNVFSASGFTILTLNVNDTICFYTSQTRAGASSSTLDVNIYATNLTVERVF